MEETQLIDGYKRPAKTLFDSMNECHEKKQHRTAVIVFNQSNFKNSLYEIERSYESYSDQWGWDYTKMGRCRMGRCLDGIDVSVRLDYYNWSIDYWYWKDENPNLDEQLKQFNEIKAIKIDGIECFVDDVILVSPSGIEIGEIKTDGQLFSVLMQVREKHLLDYSLKFGNEIVEITSDGKINKFPTTYFDTTLEAFKQSMFYEMS